MKRTERIRKNKGLRKKRTRFNIWGTAAKPRVSVFRSNRYLYAQLIDDERGKTLIGASTRGIEHAKKPKTEKAARLGELLAEKMKKADIPNAVLHRGSYRYHGQIRAFAEAMRKSGIRL